MKALVAYESMGGRTRQAAERIADALRGGGAEVSLARLGDTGAAVIEEADFVFVGSWVRGFVLFGVGPAHRARRWIESLPPLDGKRFAVFCTYAFNPRDTLATMRRMLEANGARVTGERAFKRNRPGEGAKEFVASALGAGV